MGWVITQDWLYVDDHVRALAAILERGRIGQCYTVRRDFETRNSDLVNAIWDSCRLYRTRRILRELALNLRKRRPGSTFRVLA